MSTTKSDMAQWALDQSYKELVQVRIASYSHGPAELPYDPEIRISRKIIQQKQDLDFARQMEEIEEEHERIMSAINRRYDI